MGCNKDEADRAKALAERKMLDKDFVGAKKIIIKALQLSKEVDDTDIPKMLTVCDVHCAAGAKVNAEIDLYGILQVPVTADDELIKKRYRKLALLLHPDKNKFGGAEAAFKLVGDAKITLTDHSKRSVYDMKRNSFRGGAARPPYQQPRRRAPARSRASRVNLHKHQQRKHQASNPAGPQMTFWTICPACGTRYQYYLSLLKKALICQDCLKPFIAHDLKDQAIPSVPNQRSAGASKNPGAPQNFSVPLKNATSKETCSATQGVHVNTGSHHAGVNTKRKTDGNTGGLRGKTKSDRSTRDPSKSSSSAKMKRGRRAVVESSESSISETSSDTEEEILEHGPAANSTGPCQQTRRSTRQKQEVNYNEESDDDISMADDDFVNSPSLKRSRKSGVFHGDHSNKTNGINSCSNTEDKKKGGTPFVKKTPNGIEKMMRETIHSVENSDSKEKVSHSISSNGPPAVASATQAPLVAPASFADIAASIKTLADTIVQMQAARKAEEDRFDQRFAAIIEQNQRLIEALEQQGIHRTDFSQYLFQQTGVPTPAPLTTPALPVFPLQSLALPQRVPIQTSGHPRGLHAEGSRVSHV